MTNAGRNITMGKTKSEKKKIVIILTILIS